MRSGDGRATLEWSVALVLIAAVFLTFAPALRNGFVNWDDDLTLTDNLAYRGLSAAHLRWMFTTTLAGHYQPLTWLTFAVDHALWGMNPSGYHLTSLLLHAANACMVYVLVVSVLRPLVATSETTLRVAALIGALFFAVHPLRVESVAWASERRDVLSALFYLLALLAYLRMHRAGERRRRVWLLASLVSLALSLLSKAWGITFPIVLLILDAYPLRRLGRGSDRAVLLEKVPYAVLAFAAALVAFAAVRSVEETRTLAEHGPLARLAQAAYGLCFYMFKTLVPVALSPAYLLRTPLDPTEPRYVVSVLVAGGITLAALAMRRRAPWALAAWAIYAVIVAPVLGFAQTGPQLVADRYTYLACLPFSVLLAAALVRLGRTAALRRAATAAAAAALVVLGAATVRQTTIWRDPITLWTHVLRLDPDNYVAYTNRGWARVDPKTAIADYSAAIRVNPRYYLAYFNRGNARHQRGDLEGAIDDFSTAIALLPADPKAYNNRGWSREAGGDVAGAAADYERALELAAPEWRQRDLVRGNLLRARERLAAGAS